MFDMDVTYVQCMNWACQRARKRMSLLSKRKLKKLPVHKFKTGKM